MIRQAISCDICATEKKQTNHWFVAYEQGSELRVSGWQSRNRLRPGSKHLCGQTCLHKLVDEFIAKAIAVKGPVATAEAAAVHPQAVGLDTSLTSNAACDEVESSAQLIAPPTPPAPARVPAGLVTMPARSYPDVPTPPPEEPPRFASRTWRAEAWERERQRELRADQNRPDIAPRRRSSA